GDELFQVDLVPKRFVTGAKLEIDTVGSDLAGNRPEPTALSVERPRGGTMGFQRQFKWNAFANCRTVTPMIAYGRLVGVPAHALVLDVAGSRDQQTRAGGMEVLTLNSGRRNDGKAVLHGWPWTQRQVAELKGFAGTEANDGFGARRIHREDASV